jgi:hypothetical protein
MPFDGAYFLIDDTDCRGEVGFRPRPCQGHKADHCTKILKWNAGGFHGEV